MKLIRFSEIIGFLLHPRSYKIDKSIRLTSIISCLKIYGLALLVIFIVKIIDRLLIKVDFEHQLVNVLIDNSDNIVISNIFAFILIITLLIPLFEELVFRLFLTKYNLKLVILSFSLLGGVGVYELSKRCLKFFSSDLALYYPTMFLYILLFSIPFALMIYLFKVKIEKNWERLFPYFFYLSAFLFAIYHIQAFNLNFKDILYIPIVILPYFIFGLMFGIIRVKLGFLLAVLIHVIHNLPAMVLIYRSLAN